MVHPLPHPLPHAASLDGPAFRSLLAGTDRLPAVSIDPAAATERPRDRIWELANTLHCSIVGTCLTIADGRALLAKLGVPDARTMSEHRLHGQVVHLAGRREGGGKLLQKMLDRRHEREIKRFDQARTTDAVRALWNASLERGEIPGAFWAAITHPATDWTLVQDVFGEVHMLSHLVGQSNRADIRRLRELEADRAAQDERLGEAERRIAELSAARDTLAARNGALEAIQARAPSEPSPVVADADRVSSLQARLSREQAHSEALEERVAVLLQASGRLGAALEAETGARHAAEAERDAAEAALRAHLGRIAPHAETAIGAEAETDGTLDGRTLLYVGGRPRGVATLRRYAEARNARFLGHDGGIEDSMSLLPGLVGQADLVIFPIDCVSHEATAMVKRCCDAADIPFRALRSASLAAFVHAVSVPGAPVVRGYAAPHTAAAAAP